MDDDDGTDGMTEGTPVEGAGAPDDAAGSKTWDSMAGPCNDCGPGAGGCWSKVAFLPLVRAEILSDAPGDPTHTTPPG